jgi:fructoselysine 6-kinase
MTTLDGKGGPWAAPLVSPSQREPLSLAAVGDNCLDAYIEMGTTTVGGQAVNVAVQWALLGARSEYMGPVGTDSAGAVVLEALAASGVETGHVRRVAGRTGVTEITLADRGERVFGRSDLGVCANYAPTLAELEELDGQCAWIHLANLGAIALTAERVRRTLPSVGLSYDLSDEWDAKLRDVDLRAIDVAFFSWHGEPSAAAFEQARRLALSGAGLVVGTCGLHGSFVSNGTEVLVEPARYVDVVDTCGAGDAYTAGFILEHARRRPLAECLRRATDTAAEACTYLGSFRQASKVPQRVDP